MRLQRLNLRTLMALVACVAALGWGHAMWQRSARYLKIAEDRWHAQVLKMLSLRMYESQRYRIGDGQLNINNPLEDATTAALRRVEAEQDLVAKYRRAAWQPWLPVDPDPPPPP